MSATALFIQDQLYTRSQFAKPGAKKLVKRNLARAERRVGRNELLKAASALDTELKALESMTADELEAYADAMLTATQPNEHLDDDSLEFEALLAENNAEPEGVPLHLQGSLPDWMLSELEQARGDAFALLSLFEAKRPSPKAAISTEDEALYA